MSTDGGSESEEEAFVLRFESEEVAAKVGDGELSIRWDSEVLGWVTVQGKEYRCKMVDLPCAVEPYLAVDSEVHHKCPSITKAVLVASEPYSVSAPTAFSTEMAPLQHPSGLTSLTADVTSLYAAVDSVHPEAEAEDYQFLQNTADFMKLATQDDGFPLQVVKKKSSRD